jgi:hypothetical protein
MDILTRGSTCQSYRNYFLENETEPICIYILFLCLYTIGEKKMNKEKHSLGKSIEEIEPTQSLGSAIIIGVPGILMRSVGINIFGSLISYISALIFSRLYSSDTAKSYMTSKLVSFLFSVAVTTFILESGIGEWKNKQIKKVSTVVEDKIEEFIE